MSHFLRNLTPSWVAIVVPLAICLVYAPWMSPQKFRERVVESDFVPFYVAGRMVSQGQARQLYDLTEQRRHEWIVAPELESRGAFKWFPYPPVVAFLFACFANLPLEVAYRAWGGINLMLLLLLIRAYIRSLAAGPSVTASQIAIRCLAFFPIVATLLQGQLSLLIALCLLATWEAIRARKSLEAGLWLSLLSIKPHMLLFPVILLSWKRQGAILRGLLIGSAFLTGVSWLAVGATGARDFIDILSVAAYGEDRFSLNRAHGHSWRGFLLNALGYSSPRAVGALWFLGVLIASTFLITAWRGGLSCGSRRFNLQWGALIVTMVFTSPHLHWHDLTLLSVPAVLALTAAQGEKDQRTRSGHVQATIMCGYLAIWLSTLLYRSASMITVPALILFLWLLLRENARLSRSIETTPGCTEESPTRVP